MGESYGHLNVFYEACFTQGILLILYAMTMLKMWDVSQRLNFVAGIATLLMISCVTWPIECWFQAKYISADMQGTCSEQTGQIYDDCLAYTILMMVNTVSYNAGMWLFTMRYWCLSIILSTTL